MKKISSLIFLLFLTGCSCLCDCFTCPTGDKAVKEPVNTFFEDAVSARAKPLSQVASQGSANSEFSLITWEPPPPTDELNIGFTDRGLLVQGQMALKIKNDTIVFSDLQVDESDGGYVMKSEGKVDYFHMNSKGELIYIITCHGTTKMDLHKREFSMESPRDPDGYVLNSNQIIVKDGKGKVSANRLRLQMNQVGLVSNPVFSLEGNVKIQHHVPWLRDKSAKERSYFALGDRLEYWPMQQEVVISAVAPRKVLFIDGQEKTQLRASGISLRQEAKSQQLLVHGLGEVGLNFGRHEWETFLQEFHLDQIADRR